MISEGECHGRILLDSNIRNNKIMKLSEQQNKIKRVFVSIHEHPKQEISKKNIHSKPPLQVSKFIKKKTDTSRSHTPEQNSIRPGSLACKMPGRRSISPYTTSFQDSSIPIKSQISLLAMSQISNEDSYCHPYELDSEKTSKQKHSRVSANSKKADLTPGAFSQKQIVSESQLVIKKEKENSQYFTYSGFHTDECTTVASRTPSPLLPPRNNRCSVLSRNFKINKESFANEVEKCGRDSVEALDSLRIDSARVDQKDKSCFGDEVQNGKINVKYIKKGNKDDGDKRSFMKGIKDDRTCQGGAGTRQAGQRGIWKSEVMGKEGSQERDDATPWISILNDLEHMLSNKDLSPHMASAYKRVPIKLTRGK